MSEIWQYPYVDIFKCFNLWEWKNSKKVGEVVEDLESSIGRKILTISGTVPSNNYISIPKPSAEMRTLSLKGRYIYFCLCGSDKPFAAHLEFSVPGAVRISLSNMFKEESYDKMTIHVPVQLVKDRWTTVCLDSKAMMQRHGAIKDLSEKTLLKSLTVCANIKISKIVTSDKVYDYSTFPKELGFKLACKGNQQSKYDWIEPIPCLRPVVEEKPEISQKKEIPAVKKAVVQKEKAPLEDISVEKEQLEEQARYTLIKAKSEEAKAKFLTKMAGKENMTDEEASKISTRIVKMENDALIQLRTIMGASIDRCPNICWGKVEDDKEIVYAAGSVIIAMNIATEKQRLFKGHEASVKALSLNSTGVALASAENDMIRLWNYQSGKCLGTWKAEGYSSLKNISLSPDGTLLAASGLDQRNRDLLTVWDLSTVDKVNTYNPCPEIFARQVSPYQIQCLKFGPNLITSEGESQLQLCTCGKENIKFWRLKRHMIKGTLVVLNQYSQNTFFTCLEFENPSKVYVGSKEGRILQVNAETQELELVYQLHEAGIQTLAICEAFCVTGSDDMYLRVWPQDFSEFFMEAKHESIIQSVAISSDNVEILCATESSTIGVLDIPNQKYKTIIRSHTGDILAADVLKNTMVTVSTDKTIRIWDIRSMQQIYEFSSPEDQAMSVSIGSQATQFVCGFQSGIIRVFDLGKTAVTDEVQASEKPIAIVRYLHKAELLIAISEDGDLAFFNANTHQLIKQVPAEIYSVYTGLAVLNSQQVFATIGGNATSILVWDTASLSKIITIPIIGCQVRDIAVKSEGAQILAATTDSQLRVFSIDGKVLGKYTLPSTNLGPLSKTVRLLATPNGKYACLYGFSKGILQFPLQSLAFDPAKSISQIQQLPGLEIEEYSCHTSPAKVAFYHPDEPTMFISAGNSEGIFLWSFQGNTLPPTEEDLPAGFSNLLRKSVSMAESKKLGFKLKIEEKKEEEEKVEEVKTVVPVQINIRMDASTISKVQTESEEVVKETTSEFLITKAKEIVEKKNALKIPSRHYMYCDSEEIIEKPYLDATKTLKPEFIVGYNGRAYNNIVWNENVGWVAYTVRNKLVIEQLLSKAQEIYLEHDTEISSTALSMDKEMFATSSGRRCEIVLYKVNEGKPTLTFLKQLTSANEGIHAITFVGNHKFICSLSCYPKTMVMVWNCSLGTCVASETLKYPINDIRVNLNDETYLSFATIGGNEISLWAIKPGKIAQLKRKADIADIKGTFSCFAQTKFIESEGNRLFAIGTTDGNVMLYNSRSKKFIGEYSVLEGQISCISIHDKCILIGGLSNALIRWDESGTDQLNPFTAKSRSMILDSGITSICMDKAGNEGQIGTDVGTVWYVNWEEQKLIKIHDGHLGSVVNCIAESPENAIFISSAEDQSMKVWSKDKCDELDSSVLDNVTTIVIQKDLFIAGSIDGYLKYFSLKDFNCLGKVQISKGEITASAASVGGESVFVGDSLGNVHLVVAEFLEPLVVKAKSLLTLKGITGLDTQQMGQKSRFLAALETGTVKVWERATASKKKEAFTLSTSWEFTEVDSFDLINEGTSRTFALFLERTNNVVMCTDTVKEIVVRDVRRKQVLNRFKLIQFPRCLTLLSSRNYAAIGGTEGILELMELNNGKEYTSRIHAARINVICAKGENEVITGAYGEIIKWKIA